jgi:hypothetical protein
VAGNGVGKSGVLFLAADLLFAIETVGWFLGNF